MASNRSIRDQIAILESRAASQGSKIIMLESRAVEQDRKIILLETRVAEQDRNIARLQSSFDSLMDRLQNSSARGSPGVLLPEEPRNHREDRVANSNSGFTSVANSTGNIIWNSFEASLSAISSGGDIDLSKVLEVLRREAFGYLKDWRPQLPEIRNNKSILIRAILSRRHIHKFTNDQRIFTIGKNSVWPNIVAQVFPDARGNKKLRTRLLNCMSSKKGTGKFGKFTSAVVQAHCRYCQSCQAPS